VNVHFMRALSFGAIVFVLLATLATSGSAMAQDHSVNASVFSAVQTDAVDDALDNDDDDGDDFWDWGLLGLLGLLGLAGLFKSSDDREVHTVDRTVTPVDRTSKGVGGTVVDHDDDHVDRRVVDNDVDRTDRRRNDPL
jgi:hypothetical protein